MRKGYNPGLPKIEVPTEKQQAFHTTEKTLMVFQSNDSPNAGAEASWMLLDMQILQPYPRPPKSETVGVGPSNRALSIPPGSVIHTQCLGTTSAEEDERI